RRQEVLASLADGTGLRQLTSSPGHDSSLPVISGGGAKVAFQSAGSLTGHNADFSLEIFAVNWDGTGMLQLTNHVTDSESPSLTDDGLYVYFSTPSNSGNLDIWKGRTDTGVLTPITFSNPDSLRRPVVAGGGGRVAYALQHADSYTYGQPDELDVMTGTGTNVRQLEVMAFPESQAPEITRDGTR